MDIFKLIFEHDLRLDQLRERHLDRSTQEVSSSIEQFMKPDPTYSKFYITGTDLDNSKFGLNRLSKSNEVLNAIGTALQDFHCFHNDRNGVFMEMVKELPIGEPLIFSGNESIEWDFEKLAIDDNSNVGHRKREVAEVLEEGDLVLYKEKAHDGFDLHLFSMKNIYKTLFYPIKELVDEQFRFFSMNGKRIRSERKFYFETWTLERPPHGAEEVFEDTEV
jgi:hypothetical protein